MNEANALMILDSKRTGREMSKTEERLRVILTKMAANDARLRELEEEIRQLEEKRDKLRQQ